jgi:release factor glutamine methyltransferase
MTIHEAWAYGTRRLAQASFMSDLDARLLLEFVLQQGHSYLIAHGEELLTARQAETYERLLARAEKKEPIPYVIGEAPFYGLTLAVSPAVLIPRPETEQLVDHVLAWAGEHDVHDIIDVGTGSGCIAIALAVNLPEVAITATDKSAAALAVARDNAARLTDGRVRFLQGHLLEPAENRFDVIVANLPYIGDSEWSLVDDGVKLYEPAIALEGGPDGLDLIRILLQQAPASLRPGGVIFLEIGWQQGRAVEQLARKVLPTADTTVFPDYAGHDRIVRLVV